jgi:hypothetical protein
MGARVAITYRATVGIDYPPHKRVEAGELVSDIPAKSVKWLLEQGHIIPNDTQVGDNPVDDEEGSG